jgi:hypothetical protein
VTTASRVASLGAALRALGVDFRETAVGGFVVLEPTSPPPRGFAALPPAGWTLTASHRAHELHYLVDRDAGTGWSTGQRQAPGQWLQVDLGEPQEVSRVDLLAIDWKEVPAGIQVETSEDGARWQTAVTVPDYWGPFFWSERHAFLKVRRGRVQLMFPPVRARFCGSRRRAPVTRRGPLASCSSTGPRRRRRPGSSPARWARPFASRACASSTRTTGSRLALASSRMSRSARSSRTRR